MLTFARPSAHLCVAKSENRWLRKPHGVFCAHSFGPPIRAARGLRLVRFSMTMMITGEGAGYYARCVVVAQR
jgi:hypothetical protein